MGRAIDVDKRLDELEFNVNEILLILDDLSNMNTTQEHIDLHEETKTEKTNNESSGSGSGKSNKGSSKSKSKSGDDPKSSK
tara:strand:+ start:3252 stop:3494 length:243 start_codon:yes stop_codon:yes gene_type:complete